ncbi:MAG: sel1 repeat family protein [Melioribacteraceae bacterium]|nr:sel1 repeat family protein [Melioribacteraceae bacterium]MCF8353368.1 sel1 repeat family protein [Melioribacteraceae bacterium]MCF8393053.1 sel1 repeat family protein [Melioribacteraceae bacterium]MCF8419094.1 sel1 repeat family protein [Melioribacteraceae bacterium]
MRYLTLLILFFSALSFYAQDSTKSQAFKHDVEPRDNHPFIKSKYPSYPLVAGYLLVNDANDGDPFAQHELGLRYLMGKGFKPDTVKAIQWILKAVAQNVTAARFNYAILLHNGIGVKWNPFLAFEHFKYAAEMGMPEGQFAYGLMYADNLVVSRNYNKVYKWVKIAADNNFEPAEKVLEELKKSGLAIAADSSSEDISNNYFEENELAKGSSALYDKEWELDFFSFADDEITDEDKDKQIEKLMNENPEELKKQLGITKVDSNEVEDTSSIELIKYAAEAGSPEALLIEGRIYDKGIVLKKNLLHALVSYVRAYRLGAFKAGERLFEMTKNESLFKFLKNEIDAGNPDAMYVWAGLTAIGLDYQITDDQAFELLLRAVEKNHILSIIETGLCYYSGSLVDKDIDKAFEYWENASRLGSTEAKVRIAFTTIVLADQNEKLKNEIRELKFAAGSGSVLAQAALGYCYENGKGVKQNKGFAVDYYKSSASRGNEAAYNSLKKMYDAIRPEKEMFTIYE